ncbi:hypothetical protein DFAR_1100015 [Desulfarculales bacterium]
MVTETATLRPGQSAQVLTKDPFVRATALITVGGLGVRRTLVRQVEGPVPPLMKGPIQAEDAPNACLGVLLVRSRVAAGNAARLDLGRPQVRIGYANLKVSAPRPGSRCAWSPARASYAPSRDRGHVAGQERELLRPPGYLRQAPPSHRAKRQRPHPGGGSTLPGR